MYNEYVCILFLLIIIIYIDVNYYVMEKEYIVEKRNNKIFSFYFPYLLKNNSFCIPYP